MLKSGIKRAVKGIGNFAKNEVLCAVEDYKVKGLIKKTLSSRRPERILARAKLKKFYPEVYGELNK